uniref:Variant surface glycoprotein 1125.310 n=1 Tax=Trypanosoma brucei TaxID=5691 RepID=A0A1J0R491_9TRYP|nr:variant surface glycoprotein 1125.310 [Trypanosoma brucei]
MTTTARHYLATLVAAMACVDYTMQTNRAIKAKGFTLLCGISEDFKRSHHKAAKLIVAKLVAAEELENLRTDLQMHFIYTKNKATQGHIAIANLAKVKAETLRRETKAEAGELTRDVAATALAAGKIDQTTEIFYKAAAPSSDRGCITADAGDRIAPVDSFAGFLKDDGTAALLSDVTENEADKITANLTAFDALQGTDVAGTEQGCRLWCFDAINGGYTATNDPTLNPHWSDGHLQIAATDPSNGVWKKITGTDVTRSAIKEAQASLTALSSRGTLDDAKTAVLLQIHRNKGKHSAPLKTSTKEAQPGDSTDPIELTADELNNLQEALKELRKSEAGINPIRKRRANHTTKEAAKYLYPSSETQSLCKPPNPAQPLSGKTCVEHKANATCTADNSCKWDSKEKSEGDFCKPKDGEGKKSQGTEGATGAAKPGVNCSSNTTKETCEAVTGTPPTSKAKVGGWIEEKCKDSSFLLNKKLALMGPAFMSLVSF